MRKQFPLTTLPQTPPKLRPRGIYLVDKARLFWVDIKWSRSGNNTTRVKYEVNNAFQRLLDKYAMNCCLVRCITRQAKTAA